MGLERKQKEITDANQKILQEISKSALKKMEEVEKEVEKAEDECMFLDFEKVEWPKVTKARKDINDEKQDRFKKLSETEKAVSASATDLMKKIKTLESLLVHIEDRKMLSKAKAVYKGVKSSVDSLSPMLTMQQLSTNIKEPFTFSLTEQIAAAKEKNSTRMVKLAELDSKKNKMIKNHDRKLTKLEKGWERCKERKLEIKRTFDASDPAAAAFKKKLTDVEKEIMKEQLCVRTARDNQIAEENSIREETVTNKELKCKIDKYSVKCESTWVWKDFDPLPMSAQAEEDAEAATEHSRGDSKVIGEG